MVIQTRGPPAPPTAVTNAVGVSIAVFPAIVLVISTLAVLLRAWAIRLRRRPFGAEDYLVFVAYVCLSRGSNVRGRALIGMLRSSTSAILQWRACVCFHSSTLHLFPILNLSAEVGYGGAGELDSTIQPSNAVFFYKVRREAGLPYRN